MFFGVQTLGHQKIDVFPEFAPVSVEIQTACLGLSPTEVESLTTVPLEAALQGVPGVYDIRSDSEPQLSAIFLYFRQGTYYLHARPLVQERLQTTSPTLPTWCDPPQMYPIVSATSRVMQIGLTSSTVSPVDLSTIAQWTIRPRLMNVPGVANVAIWGERQKQVMVEADPAAMAAHKITLDQLLSTTADSVDTGELKYTNGAAVGSLGFVQSRAERLYVRSIQPIQTPGAMGGVPIADRTSGIVRLRQAAHVGWGYPPLVGDAVIDGGPGLMLVIEKFPGANTLQVTAGVTKALAALSPGLSGIKVDTHIFRQATFIELAIHNLGLSVLLGCILVVFVLFAFLFQRRAAFVSLLAIPLSLAAAAIVFDATGATINTMILAGFAVSVGVVVDDAIIDMENITRRLRAWRAGGRRITPLHLVLAASLEVRIAIFYATLINIVAVIPVMIVGGLTGAFFEPLALAYGLAVVAIAAGVVLYPRLGSDLFPSFKEPDFLMHFVTKPGTSVGEQDRQVTDVQHELLAIPGIRHVGSHIGQARLGEEVSGVNFSENWISLQPGADYAKVLASVRAVAAGHPGAFSDVQTYLHERIDEVISNGTTEDLAVRIYGPNLVVLERLGNEVTRALAHIRGLVDVQPAPLEFIPEADVTVKAAVAKRYGLSPGTVRRAAAILMASEPVAEIPAHGRIFTVSLWSTPATHTNLTELKSLLIDTRGGGHVALGKVASIAIRPSPSSVFRENGQRDTEVDANVSGHDLGSVTAAVHAALASVRFPRGYTTVLLGEATERAAAQRRLLYYGIAALVVILLLLQAAFQAWRISLLEFLTLPMALVGGVLTAWAGLGTITLGALVGFFTVLGIAARNGILMLSHWRHLEEFEHEPFGVGLVMRGASERLSPILMTALATALAVAPLVFFGNRPGQEIEFPMAVVILGGLATSTLLNLFVLPALYLRVGRPRSSVGRRGPPHIPAQAGPAD